MNHNGNNPEMAHLVAVVLVLAAGFASCLVYTYLPLSTERLPLSIGCLSLGVLSAAAFHWAVTRMPKTLWGSRAIISCVAAVLLTPLLSRAIPRITYSRFGLTVYGAVPVPLLDITINRHGSLWFRHKIHQITRAELDALMSPGVEIIIVGVGWESIAQLTDEAKLVANTFDLRVLPTPEAFAMFNQLRAQGRIVVLIAHSTC